MRERLLAAIGRLAVSRPYAVLAAAALLGAAAIALLPSLRFSSSRFELIGDDADAAVESRHDLVVAVTAEAPETARAAADALAGELAATLDQPVFHRVDPALFRGREALFLPPDELRAAVAAASRADDPTVATIVGEVRRGLGPDEEVGLDELDATLEDEPPPEERRAGLRFVTALLGSLADYLDDPASAPRFGAAEETALPIDAEGYLASRDGRTLYLFVPTGAASDRVEDVAPAVRAAREVADDVERDHSVAIALTGYPALAVDEVRAIRNGSVITGLLAAAIVIVLFAWSFRSIGGVVVAGASLGLGMAWAFGMIVLSVGELNLLTQAAAPVFAGLGIDFAVHLLAAYEAARRDRPHADAVDAAMRGAGKGILTGALTTAGAFFAMTVADYRAIRELGLVAGAGLLLVLAAVLFVVPALLGVGERRDLGWLQVGAGARPRGTKVAAAIAARVTARPAIVVGLAAAVTVALGLGIGRVGFDPDVEALLPASAPSVLAARAMERESAFTNEHMVTRVGDLAALRALAARMRALPSVGRVESAAAFVPADPAASLAILRGASLGSTPSATEPPGDLAASLRGLSDEAAEAAAQTRRLGATAPADELAALADVARRAADAHDDAEDAGARVARFDAALAERVDRVRGWIANASTMEPPRVDGLPPALRERLVLDEGYALYVYPSGDLFADGALDAFVRDVRSVAPDATGQPALFASFLDRMAASTTRASGLALLVVALILAADFRRVRDVALALVPVALGAAWLVGLMGWLGVDANLANVAALPLIVGVGVDDGVHLIHRHRQRGRSADALAGVLRAVALTTATTVAGFGVIGLAPHRGMQSFALVMVIGAIACLLATVLVLPALLRLAYPDRSESSSTRPSSGSQR